MTSMEGLQPLSFICSGSEPFRPMEHLTVCRRWNIPANKSGDSTGKWIYVSIDLIFLSSSTLVRIQDPSPTLFSQICYLTQWIWVWNCQIYLDLNHFDLLCYVFYSIYQPWSWSHLFLTWSFILLVFWIYSGNHTCAVGNKQCHHMNPVSHKWCHRLSAVIQK